MTKDLVNTSGASNVALNGYDPVAFFTVSTPMNGDFNVTATHRGATYYFTTEQNKRMFESNPDKYAPQTGGFCTFGVSVGALFPVDINTAQVYKDKLYVNLNPGILDMFNKDRDDAIAKAEKNWTGLVAKNGV